MNAIKIIAMQTHEMLRYLRKKERITQNELAERCGILQPNIARFERDGGSLETAEKIANALGYELFIKKK